MHAVRRKTIKTLLLNLPFSLSQTDGEGREDGGLVGAATLLHHFCPAHGACRRLGGEGREEGGLISAAAPLHHTDPCPAHGACGRLKGERGGRREASSALPLHFTTQIPVPLTA